MKIRDIKIAVVVMVALGALALIGCGGGEQPVPTLNPDVTPLTGPVAESNMAIKTAAGLQPCGVFNVNGFGSKKVPLASFPGCSAAGYRVLCLNDKAQWNNANVSDVALSADKMAVTFTSAQDGTCGLFATQ
jgi:hypothetical protein